MNHRPKRSLGQNFLHDVDLVERIIDALDLVSGEDVVEIGSGRGALTERLVERGAKVTAVEFDRDLAPDLQRRLGESVRVIEADALSVDLDEVIAAPPVKLVANLPYNISTPILQRLISERERLSRLVLMFQREVVERMIAEPRTNARGFLSVLAQMAFAMEYLFDVPPSAFYPIPKVWSAVVRLTPKPRLVDEEKLKALVSVGFAHRRKTLANNLSALVADAHGAIRGVGLPEKCRAEELSLDDWRRLLGHL